MKALGWTVQALSYVFVALALRNDFSGSKFENETAHAAANASRSIQGGGQSHVDGPVILRVQDIIHGHAVVTYNFFMSSNMRIGFTLVGVSFAIILVFMLCIVGDAILIATPSIYWCHGIGGSS
eukprot:TRINITY_DN6130_c0_g5_i1.p1 TRINITY_DN6130_c0_g5~~TRINITY_DN6130_c0_g5_i1.p1  ORF type:complete len:124 (-),score=7.93 TRINITY_DN6130_c0_g5_i1:311-682(-)